jgi:dTDP-4-dehydrorhamnose 3,5-epimerase
MDNKLISGVFLKPLKIFPLEHGDVLLGLKANEKSFVGFGEAYFTFINFDRIKAWKKHRKATLNLIVPIGEIKFVIFDDRAASPTFEKFFTVTLSNNNNYQRLTIPPMLWMGFKGIGKQNLLLDIMDIRHDLDEEDSSPVESIPYSW